MAYTAVVDGVNEALGVARGAYWTQMGVKNLTIVLTV